LNWRKNSKGHQHRRRRLAIPGCVVDVPSKKMETRKINDPKETSTAKRSIQFANHDIWNTSLGTNLIGSTKVAR